MNSKNNMTYLCAPFFVFVNARIEKLLPEIESCDRLTEIDSGSGLVVSNIHCHANMPGDTKKMQHFFSTAYLLQMREE